MTEPLVTLDKVEKRFDDFVAVTNELLNVFCKASEALLQHNVAASFQTACDVEQFSFQRVETSGDTLAWSGQRFDAES